MKVWKRSMAPVVLASLMIMLLVSACGSNNNNTNTAATNTKNNTNATTNADTTTNTNTAATDEATKPADPPVELSYYYIVYEMPADQQEVEDAINAYIEPKINAKIKLKPVLESGYKDKINTMLAANEAFDILWTSNWGGGDYDNKVAKGALMPLNDLLDKTPDLKAAIPQVAWDDTMVDGKIYGVPNMQIAAKADGFAIQKRFVDKYNLDLSNIKTPLDIEPILKTIHENEKDIIPIATTRNMFDFGREFGYAPQSYKIGDPSHKIINALDKPEAITFFDTVRKWYQAGYIYKDAATMKDDALVSLLNTGKVAVEWNTTMKPGGEIDDAKRFGNNDIVYVRVSEPEFTGVRPTMNSISNTSKNPEKALEFLQLTSTDPTLFNLLTFGIKDKHYTVVGDNTIKINQDGGYKGDQGWVFGNVLIGYLKEGQPADTWEKTKQLNETAKRPEMAGFNFNVEPFKTESVNIFAVNEQYGKALSNGAVDPAKVLPKYKAALKKAGEDKQTAEMQKQVDEWFAAHPQQ